MGFYSGFQPVLIRHGLREMGLLPVIVSTDNRSAVGDRHQGSIQEDFIRFRNRKITEGNI